MRRMYFILVGNLRLPRLRPRALQRTFERLGITTERSVLGAFRRG
jgi:hypothetical protein